ncbi:restriction endonuclease [Eggerthella sp. NSJ-70]|uniref:Restriction endonuclease n=2 Tax=Eggerthella hominis TaxID=2763043 RepID=A0ABR7BMP0_9ACTN|nr:restriction endonuclease [Eggerthella hominis]
MQYAAGLSGCDIPDLYRVTDGKAVGTYVEAGFKEFLITEKGAEVVGVGNAAKGIDFPNLNVDLKVTSCRQPQSSCPFRNAEQKIYGLGFHLLVMVYCKKDDDKKKTSRLDFEHVIFIEKERTSDYVLTNAIRNIIDDPLSSREAAIADIDGLLQDKQLPLEEIARFELAQRIYDDKPELGCLTISNALQWRLQYARAIDFASRQVLHGIEALYG